MALCVIACPWKLNSAVASGPKKQNPVLNHQIFGENLISRFPRKLYQVLFITLILLYIVICYLVQNM